MVYTATLNGRKGRFARNSALWCRQRLITAGLAGSDAFAFGLACLLFRTQESIPTAILYHGKPLTPGSNVFVVVATLFIIFRWVAGDYSRRQLFWDGTRLTTRALAIVAAPDSIIYILVGGTRWAWSIIGCWIFLFLAVPILRQCTRLLLTKLGLWKLPTALLGNSANAREAFQVFSHSISLGFDVQHLIVEDDEETPPTLLNLNRIYMAPGGEFVRRLLDVGCRQVIIASDKEPSGLLKEQIQHIIAADIGVGFVPSLRGLPLSGLTMNYFFGKEILLLQVRNNLARIPYRVLKSLLDFVGSAVLLVVLSPLFIAIMIAISVSDGGRPFFVQQRLGRRGREFNCFKFRSMTADAEHLLAMWQHENPDLLEKYKLSNFKLRNDPRVTRLGRWLRCTSLDELPQLLNVLLGDMSLVGPRPLLTREIPEYGSVDRYCLCRPGITGLWQISGRSETTFKDRVVFDDWYIRNWSIWYDLVILFQTIGVLIQRKGAY